MWEKEGDTRKKKRAAGTMRHGKGGLDQNRKQGEKIECISYWSFGRTSVKNVWKRGKQEEQNGGMKRGEESEKTKVNGAI